MGPESYRRDRLAVATWSRASGAAAQALDDVGQAQQSHGAERQGLARASLGTVRLRSLPSEEDERGALGGLPADR
jgi:hypothetical protein